MKEVFETIAEFIVIALLLGTVGLYLGDMLTNITLI